MHRIVLALALCLANAASVSAQMIAFGTRLTQTNTIQLGYPLMTLVALPPQPPFTIAPGSKLQLLAPADMTPASVVWYKNNTKIAATGATLELTVAAPADSGAYRAEGTANGRPTASDTVNIRVDSPGQRLLNVSVRARIDSAQPSLISGFVIEPGPSSVLLLVRAVGPTLSRFGVTDALPEPQLRVFDSTGRERSPALGLYIPPPSEAARQVGAFPLTAGGKDAAQMYLLPAGAYTAQVSGTAGANGTVLLEVYEAQFNFSAITGIPIQD